MKQKYYCDSSQQSEDAKGTAFVVKGLTLVRSYSTVQDIHSFIRFQRLTVFTNFTV